MITPLRILLLEDNAADAEMIERSLKKGNVNFECRVAANKEEYLLALDEFKPGLILSDNTLPQFNGSEALQIIQERFLHIPFILVTGTTSEEFAACIIKAGADDYFLKDSLAKLPAAIETSLKQRQSEKEKKETTEKLKQGEEKRKLIMNAALDAIICIDTKGKITFWNPQAEKIFGWKEEDVTGRTLSETIIPETFRQMHEKGMDNYIKTGHGPILNLLMELKAINRQQKEFPIELTILSIKQGGEEFFCAFIRDITERKKTEQIIKENEQRYQTLAEVSPVGIFHTDATGYTTYVNPCWCQISGFSFQEALGNGWLNAVHKDDKKALFKSWQNTTVLQKPALSEYRFVRPDGTIAWVIGQATPERNSEGHIVGYVGTITDITERKIAESAIRQSEEKYRTLIEQASDGIFIADENGKYIDVNEKACQLLGYSKKEITNFYIKDFVVVDKEFIPLRFDDLKSGKTVIQKRKLKRKDGSVVLVEISARILPDGTMLGMVRDLTERIESELKLLKEKDLSDKIINSLPGIFYLSDQTPGLLRWNTALEKISGYTEAELAKIQPITLFDPEDHATLRQQLEKAYKEGVADVEVKLLNRGGQRIPYYFTGVGIEYGGKPAVLGIGIDISERKKKEEELKKANERFEMIARATNDAVFELDLLTGESWHNKAFLQLYNLAGKIKPDLASWKSKLHPDDRERVIKKLETTYAGSSTSWVDEFRFQKAGGSYGIFYDRAYITRDESGKAIRITGSMTDITELKKVEEQLKESEEKYRSLIEQASDAIFINDEEHNILDVNESACTMLGYSKQQLCAMKINDLYTAKELIARPIMQKELRRGEKTSIERNILHSNGSEIPVDITAKMLSDGRIIAIIRDISERKKIEQQLSQEKQLLRTLIDNLPDYIYVKDMELRHVINNVANIKLIGASSEKETLGKTAFDYFKPELAQQYMQDDRIILESKKPMLNMEEPIINNKGERRWLLTTKIPLQDKDNNVIGLVGISRDITQQKIAEQKIITEKELSNSIINSLPGIFYLYDEKGKFLRWNKNFETISGYTTEEVSQMHPLDFFDVAEKQFIAENIGKVFEKGMADVEAHFFTKNNKKIFYYFNGWAAEFEGRNCLIGMGIDITERKKTEEALNQSYKEIRQLASHLQDVREEERAEMSREIHDELGQQITGLKLDVSWLSKKIITNDQAINNKIKEVLELLDSTVKTVRKIATDLRPSILDDLGLIEAMKWQSQEFQKRSGIKTQFSTSMSAINTAGNIAIALFRIYQESLTNVARHAEASIVTATLKEQDDQLILSIADNGKGFDITKTVSKKTLGLLGMKERTLMMGGEYQIISHPGKGTQVIVAVPLHIS